jgi:hypothetical protein
VFYTVWFGFVFVFGQTRNHSLFSPHLTVQAKTSIGVRS